MWAYPVINTQCNFFLFVIQQKSKPFSVSPSLILKKTANLKSILVIYMIRSYISCEMSIQYYSWTSLCLNYCKYVWQNIFDNWATANVNLYIISYIHYIHKSINTCIIYLSWHTVFIGLKLATISLFSLWPIACVWFE